MAKGVIVHRTRVVLGFVAGIAVWADIPTLMQFIPQACLFGLA